MIKNIVWDFDGTLIDTYGIMSKAFCIALNKRNIIAKEDEINKLLKISSEYAISYFKLDNSFKKIWKDEEKRVDKNLSKPFENVVNVLKYIVKNGGKNYIVTHRDKTTFEYLKFYNLEKYFEDILTIEEADYRKPNIDMFEKIISRNNIDVKETLSVGDRILDMIPSKEIDCIVDITVENYNELLKILINNNIF